MNDTPAAGHEIIGLADRTCPRTLSHAERVLHEVATRHGWEATDVFSDADGGSRIRFERPAQGGSLESLLVSLDSSGYVWGWRIFGSAIVRGRHTVLHGVLSSKLGQAHKACLGAGVAA